MATATAEQRFDELVQQLAVSVQVPAAVLDFFTGARVIHVLCGKRLASLPAYISLPRQDVYPKLLSFITRRCGIDFLHVRHNLRIGKGVKFRSLGKFPS